MLNINKDKINKKNNDKFIIINTNNGSLKQRQQRAKYLSNLLDHKLSKFVESRITNDFKKDLKL